MGRTIGLDWETTMIPRHHPWIKGSYPVVLCLVDETGWKENFIFNHNDYKRKIINQRQLVQKIQPILDGAERVVAHNLKFDYNWCRYVGLNLDHLKLWCTAVTEYMLRGQVRTGIDLASLSKFYHLQEKIDRVKTFWEAGIDTDQIKLSVLLPYVEQDAFNTLAIYQRQVAKVNANGMQRVVALQNELVRILSTMECNGMKFSREVADKYIKELTEQLDMLNFELRDLFGWDVDLDSNDELSAALYGGKIKREGEEWALRKYKKKLRLYTVKCDVIEEKEGAGFEPLKGTEVKKEGYYQTNKDTIKRLKATNKKKKRIKEALLARSQANKALTTFVGKGESTEKGLINKIQSDGCIHSQYNQTVTKTGRLSSSDPNGQNLPRKGTSPIKLSIVPRFDYILNADLSQLEWRVGAWCSQDEVMIQEIQAGLDIHKDNAIRFFGVDADANFDNDPVAKANRTTAKVMTFRLLYGGSAYGFHYDQSMPNLGLKKWQAIVEAFYEKYSGLKRWQDDNIALVNKNNGVLRGATGRIFHITYDTGWKEGYNRSQICNYPVQSLATADITPLAMYIITQKMRERDMRSLVIGQVHDSIVFDVIAEELELLAKLCIWVFQHLPMYIKKYFGLNWNVPLNGDCEYGESYGDLKKLDVELLLAA